MAPSAIARNIAVRTRRGDDFKFTNKDRSIRSTGNYGISDQNGHDHNYNKEHSSEKIRWEFHLKDGSIQAKCSFNGANVLLEREAITDGYYVSVSGQCYTDLPLMPEGQIERMYLVETAPNTDLISHCI